jgi:hypothetical protein
MDGRPTFRVEMKQTFGKGHLSQQYEITRGDNDQFENTSLADSLTLKSQEELFELSSLLQHILDTTNP